MSCNADLILDPTIDDQGTLAEYMADQATQAIMRTFRTGTLKKRSLFHDEFKPFIYAALVPVISECLREKMEKNSTAAAILIPFPAPALFDPSKPIDRYNWISLDNLNFNKKPFTKTRCVFFEGCVIAAKASNLIYAAARCISPEIASRFSNGQSLRTSYMGGHHGCYQALLAKMRQFFPANRVGSYRMWTGDDSENEGVKKRNVGKTSSNCNIHRSVVSGVAATKHSVRENDKEEEAAEGQVERDEEEIGEEEYNEGEYEGGDYSEGECSQEESDYGEL